MVSCVQPGPVILKTPAFNRAVIIARDDLVTDLGAEREVREQLERDVVELLESGLVSEVKEKQEEFEASGLRRSVISIQRGTKKLARWTGSVSHE